MEENIVERPLMNEEEFEEYLEKNKIDAVGDLYEKNILHLRNFESVNSYKSIRRAIKRGNVSIDGYKFPKRPFNNRANTCDKERKKHSRTTNELKKQIYEHIKYRQLA